ncbi:MAG: hypothetical protein KAU48_14255, partial [Candidatus Thorarchaeota archaeon]|nr:hypothetical protein [Candidatus Thorarchaeota archaeon]
DDLEKELQKALEDYGVDPEDFKAKWRDQFVKDIEEYLNEQPEKQDNDSNEEDIEGTSGQKSGVERASQHDAGSGQMYELETTPSVESDTEAETEPQSEPVVDTQEPETSPESEPPKERVQPPLEKSEPSSEPDAVPMEHERPSSKENVEEPEIESVPAEKPSNKTKSVEDTVIQEKANPRTEQTTVEIPQETSKSEKEIESDETKVEAETETSELETKVNETKEEVETESQEPEQVDDSEDLAWQEQLMQIYNETPEEWREVFREYLRGLVEDEEDLRRLLEKHGLEYILEDEEQMDEVRKFLEFKEALREQGKENLESIAEELEIDMEQAEQWASGEVEPQIIVDVLNLEAYWSFWELLRLNAERDFPESVKDLEEILQDNPMLELADPTLPFELWKKDAKAWVEIMGMKKRGEIRTKLRNGREIYHREDIERLSAKYSLPKAEIISWLRGEKAPPLIRKIGK